MTDKKPSLGEKALELHETENFLTPVEAGEGIATLIPQKLEKIIKENKDFGDEYYIQIIFQQENFHQRVDELANVHHLQQVVTLSDPGMRPDRSCWKYNNKEDKLIYLWSLPDIHSCVFILKNALALAPDEMELLGYVKKFYDQCRNAIRQKNPSLNI